MSKMFLSNFILNRKAQLPIDVDEQKSCTKYPRARIQQCIPYRNTCTKIGTIQRRLAWPLRKDDTQNREAFHIFLAAVVLRSYLMSHEMCTKKTLCFAERCLLQSTSESVAYNSRELTVARGLLKKYILTVRYVVYFSV